jgi:hypothetical protein
MNQGENMLDCKKCEIASQYRTFKLCDSCTKHLENLKTTKKAVMTVDTAVYRFMICLEGKNSYSIEMGNFNGNECSHLFEGRFLDIKHCQEFIKSWVKTSFNMRGVFVELTSTKIQ